VDIYPGKRQNVTGRTTKKSWLPEAVLNIEEMKIPKDYMVQTDKIPYRIQTGDHRFVGFTEYHDRKQRVHAEERGKISNHS